MSWALTMTLCGLSNSVEVVMFGDKGSQGSKDFAGQDFLRRVDWRRITPALVLVVLLLMGVAALCMKVVKDGQETANRKVTQTRMRKVAEVVEVFASKQEPYRLPSSLREAYGGVAQEQVEGRLDAWGNPLSYKVELASDEEGFVLLSNGADGVLGTEDDVRYAP